MGKLALTTAQVAAKLAARKQKTATIATTAWVTWTGSGSTSYPVRAKVLDADILASSVVRACFNLSTDDAACEAGVAAFVDGDAGFFWLYAKKTPSIALVSIYEIQVL